MRKIYDDESDLQMEPLSSASQYGRPMVQNPLRLPGPQMSVES